MDGATSIALSSQGAVSTAPCPPHPEWNLTVRPGTKKAELRARTPCSFVSREALVLLLTNARILRLHAYVLSFSLSSTSLELTPSHVAGIVDKGKGERRDEPV